MSDQQLNELVKAIKRVQFTKIKEILVSGDAEKLLSMSYGITRSIMDLTRRQFGSEISHYQTFFNIIRDVGGDRLLMKQFTPAEFHSVLDSVFDAELFMFFVETNFNLGGEAMLRRNLEYNKEKEYNALYEMSHGSNVPTIKLLRRALVWYLVKFDLFEDMYFELSLYTRANLFTALGIKETFPADPLYLETTALVQKLVANGFTKIPDEFLADCGDEPTHFATEVKQEAPQSSMSPLRNLVRIQASPSNPKHANIIADLQKSLEEEKAAHASEKAAHANEKAAHEVTKQQLQVSTQLLAQSTQLVRSSTQLLQQSEAGVGGGNSNSVSRRRQREEEEALSTLLSSGTRRTREGEEVTAVEAGEGETTTSSDPLSKEGILDQLKMMKTNANIPSAFVGEIDGLIEYITRKGDDMSIETMVRELNELEDRVMESVLKKNDPPARYG